MEPNNSNSRGSDEHSRNTSPVRSISPQRQKQFKQATTPSGLSVATFPTRSASIDDTPATSTASSSPNSPFSSSQSPWSPDPASAGHQNASSSTVRPSLISPFAHPLDNTRPYTTNQQNNQHHNSSFQRPLPGRFGSGMPMTPGEEKMVFDKGLLFSSHHRPSTRSDTTNELFSEPLPELSRASSDPEIAGETNSSNYHYNDQQYQGDTDLEICSAPIYMPVIHHPAPSPSTSSHSQRSFSPRTPSPNPSTTLSAQQPHSALTSTSSLHHTPLGDSTNNSSTPHSAAPSSLRPDSSSTSSLARPVRTHQHSNVSQGSSSSSNITSSSSSTGPFSGPSSSSMRASPAPTVITHHDVLQSSELIMSREQLFDALNGDDDDDDDDDDDNGELAHPKPGFARGQRRTAASSRSSLPRSSASSYRSGSGIELNTKVQKPVPAKLSGASDIESGHGHSRREKELVSAAMVSSGGENTKERLSTLDSTEYLPTAYPQKSTWLENKRRTNRKWRRTCCAVGLLVFIGVIAGIAIGFVSRKNKVDGLAPPVDPEKPTTTVPVITQFPPNPDLHKSFYGLDYNPAKTIMPWCGASLQEVVNDINLISQLTNRVRLYGMDCNQADLTFQAINLLKLNTTMKVVLTVWVDKNATTYERQVNSLFRVLDTYGTAMVQGISVGNEALFRKDVTLKDLGDRMATIRNTIKSRYSNANIPIFTSEIGNNLKPDLASLSDELSGNLHPYFAGTDIKSAAQWTFDQYNNTMVENPTPTGLAGTISEVGWPSAPASSVNLPSAVPGLANLQTMIDTFVCQANAVKMPYYWFEFKDEPWKNDPTNLVEPNWGLLDSKGNLKVKIPDCPAP
ncbi:hypothetical protein BGZ95_007742 [Linnemannia exigua]|uniref:glucan endo-1,3-beta-D-glucosidase n=1 Tax=Linnemannia exigua TaxID=604196 RepID=A0AAD4DGJ9_9FUNG|nr:hypothetical protein BGZ95_007742 [Linnemannia exigua]